MNKYKVKYVEETIHTLEILADNEKEAEELGDAIYYDNFEDMELSQEEIEQRLINKNSEPLGNEFLEVEEIGE